MMMYFGNGPVLLPLIFYHLLLQLTLQSSTAATLSTTT